MPISDDELKALRLLLREELHAEIHPFRNEVGERFNEVATQIDGLYHRDEKREQEYLSIREQIRRLESRFS
jgi:predicted nuclease with TOPRIM domain